MERKRDLYSPVHACTHGVGGGGKCECQGEKAVDSQPIASLVKDVCWEGFQ